MSSNNSENISMNIDEKESSEIQPPENVTIPFILLTNLHNIMVAAGDRGAFKTAEMFDIGRVYKEVQTYLTQHINVAPGAQIDASSLPEPELASVPEEENN